MNIGALIEQFLFSELSRFFESKSDLTTGQKISARVLEIKPDGKVLLDFEGKFRALAKTDFPVQTGQILKLELTQKGEMLKFSLAQNQQQVSLSSIQVKDQQLYVILNNLLKKIEQNFSRTQESEEVQALFRLLKNFQESVKINISEKFLTPQKVARILQKTVEESGIFLEKKLFSALKEALPDYNLRRESQLPNLEEDLRANLLKLLTASEKIEQKTIQTETRELLRAILQFIEASRDSFFGQQQGALNTESFLLPVFTSEGMSGFFKILRFEEESSEKEGRKKKNGFRLLLLLNTTALKTVLADFLLLADNLQIAIYLETRELQLFFINNLLELEQALQKYFPSFSVRVLAASNKREELFGEIFFPAEKRMLDIRV